MILFPLRNWRRVMGRWEYKRLNLRGVTVGHPRGHKFNDREECLVRLLWLPNPFGYYTQGVMWLFWSWVGLDVVSKRELKKKMQKNGGPHVFSSSSAFFDVISQVSFELGLTDVFVLSQKLLGSLFSLYNGLLGILPIRSPCTGIHIIV